MHEELLTIKEAAHRYGVSYDRLRRAAWDGRLETRGTGHARLVAPAEVERFIAMGRRKETPALPPLRRENGPLGRVIAVAILKGGTAKTTTTMSLGAAFSERGLRVLLIDNDHQCSLTRALGIEPMELDPARTLYGAMQTFMGTRKATLDQVILSTQANVDLVPAHIRLSRTDKELQLTARREYVLRQLLAPVAPQYDVVLIDTMPTNNNLVFNALVAAHELLIPLEPEPIAIEALSLTLDEVAEVRETGLNPDLQIAGVLMTQVDARLVVHRDLMDNIRADFGQELPIFEAYIRRSPRFPESQAHKQTIFQYDPSGTGAAAYRALAEELGRGWQ
ncbi:MAG: AAA family ATPase [Chloroflexota bacterium]|nr:AAA family ATPase [Chloroflexota bacterium]